MIKSFIASALYLFAAQFAVFAAAAASYNPVGPQTNVPLSAVTDGGWTQCYGDSYQNSGTTLSRIRSQCNGAQLMLACRPAGSQTIQLLAQAPRADVLFDTADSNTPWKANGSGWYYSGNYSWGFAAGGDPLSRDKCDVNTSGANDQRLCWQTVGGLLVAGWRCGADTNLQGSNYERLIFQPLTTEPRSQR